jgi:hypothetical protein
LNAQSPINMQGSFSSAMTVSALGWIAAVLSVALALFVGKPYYMNRGYEQGRLTQAEANIIAVDASIQSKVIEGADYVVYGRVLSKSADILVISPLNPMLTNPLRKEARQQIVIIDDQTIMESRTVLPEAQYHQAVLDGERRGLTTDQIKLYTVEPLDVDDVLVGDELQIFPVVAQDAVKDQYTAKKILKTISNQSSQSN